MNSELIYKLGRWMPRFIKEAVRPVVDRAVMLFSYELDGPLKGYRMKGRVSQDYTRPDYEPETCDALSKIVKKGWICVDVGAHYGYFVLLTAIFVGETGRVIAFEAHPGNAKILKSTIEINGVSDRVRLVRMAVSDGSEDTVKLYGRKQMFSMTWNIMGYDVTGPLAEVMAEVPATSLDAYFEKENNSPINLVKMDIEGAEVIAIPGMKRILDEKRPLVIIEFHNQDAWDTRKILYDSDYTIYDLYHNLWLEKSMEIERHYHCLCVPDEKVTEYKSIFT